MSLKDKIIYIFPVISVCSGFIYLLTGFFTQDWQIMVIYYLLVTCAISTIVYGVSYHLGSQLSQIVNHFSKFTRHLFENGQLYHRVQVLNEPLFEDLANDYNLFLEKIEASITDLLQALNLLNAGVLLIDRNLMICEDYSNKSQILLGFEQLKGKSLEQVFIKGCEEKYANLLKERLLTAFDLLIPEQFASAIKDIPKIIKYKNELNEEKTFIVEFAALNLNGSINAILMTFTQDRNLNTSHFDQTSSLRKASQIIARLSEMYQDHHDFTEVYHTLNEFIPLSSDVRREVSELSINTDLNSLFRKLHTIKGGVRNLRFDHLSHFSHEIEKVIAQLRKNSITIKQINRIELNRLATDLESGLRHVRSFWQKTQNDQSIKHENIWESYIENLKKSVNYIALDLGKQVNIKVEAISPFYGKDLTFIKKILVHLVRNAVDHGIELPSERKAKNKPEQGQILIKTFSNKGIWQLIISDDGRGIDSDIILKKAKERKIVEFENKQSLNHSEILELICHPGFSSKNDDEISEISGHGVGMDAVKQDIEDAKGQLAITSSGKNGTTFEVTWQSLESRKQDIKPKPLNKRVLFVDDEPDMVTIMSSIFKNTDIELYTARSLSEAEEIINNRQIAVVVTDYKLEAGTGLQLLAYLATDFSQIETIVVSGFIDEEFKKKATEIGVFACLEKPVKAKEVIKLTKAALGKYNGNNALEDVNYQAQAS